MSIRVMTNVWDHGPAQPHLRLLLLALADNANDQGTCWPSVETLARKCAVQPRGLQKNLRQLEADGWIVSTPQAGRSTRYTLQLGRLTPVPQDTPALQDTPVLVAIPTPVLEDTPPLSPGTPKPSVNRQPEPSEETLAIQLAPQDFDAFWAAYPRRIGKGQALRAWKAAAKVAPPARIIAGAQAFAAHVVAQGTSAQYVPYPATWLNGIRWDDDLTVDQAAARANRMAQDVAQDGSWARTGDGGW